MRPSQRTPSFRPTTAVALTVLLVAPGPAGCGGAGIPPVRWQDAMQSWFSNSSVSPEQPPRPLWTRQDEELFLRRIGYADVVAIGGIRLVNLCSRFDTPSELSVAFRPTEVLHGELKRFLDQRHELPLQLRPSDLDFQLALRVRSHLPGRRFVLLLKLKPDASGDAKRRRPVLRWALYRPEPRLLAEIRAMYRWLEKKDERPPEDEPQDEPQGQPKGKPQDGPQDKQDPRGKQGPDRG